MKWKDNAKKIGEQIDETTIRIQRVEGEVDKATVELITTNKKLKAIVDKVTKIIEILLIIYSFLF